MYAANPEQYAEDLRLFENTGSYYKPKIIRLSVLIIIIIMFYFTMELLQCTFAVGESNSLENTHCLMIVHSEGKYSTRTERQY